MSTRWRLASVLFILTAGCGTSSLEPRADAASDPSADTTPIPTPPNVLAPTFDPLQPTRSSAAASSSSPAAPPTHDHHHRGGPPVPASSPPPVASMTAVPSTPTASAAAEKYACPMHPEVQSDGPAKCPKCKMALERQPHP